MYPEIPNEFGLGRFHFSDGAGTTRSIVTMGFGNGTSISAAGCQGALYGAITASGGIMSVMSSGAALVQVDAVVNIGGVLSEDSASYDVVGGTSSNPISPAVCVLMRKTTALLGRHYSGRSYFPYCPVSLLQPGYGELTTGGIAAWQNAATVLLDSMTGAIIPPYLLHRDTAITPTVVNGFAIEGLLATQRRRQRKAAHR